MKHNRAIPAFVVPLIAAWILVLSGCIPPAPVITPPTETPTTPDQPTTPELPTNPTPPAQTDTGVVAQPTFSPAAGTYTSAQSVTIACATSSATVRYTLDGSQPTDTSTSCSGAISVSASTTIRAIAMKTDMMSSFGRADYTITGKVEKPVVSPGTGNYSAPVEVTITCGTTGADIHYRLDGAVPTSTDPIYGGPFTLSDLGCVTALAMKSGWEDSDWSFSTIAIQIPSDKAAPPTISPAGGLYYNDQSVTISAPAAQAIWYTTDDTDPTTSGTRTQYTGVISVTMTGTEIRAYAIDSEKTDPNSDVVGATYRLKVATPVPDPLPSAGPLSSGATITLSTTTIGAAIKYAVDGGGPTSTYAGGVYLNSPHLRAVATRTGFYEDSDVLIAEYLLKTSFAYTDGSGHIYQLCYNGPDIEITSLFESASNTVAFSVDTQTSPYHSYCQSQGHVYRFNKTGADQDITASLESFQQDSVIFNAGNWLVYRTGNHLYLYSESGSDSEVTLQNFSATSEIVYLLYTDGVGHVYTLSLSNPVDQTSTLEHFTYASHLVWVDAGQTSSIVGYTSGENRYIVNDAGPDPLFDPSEYEHFSLSSVIAPVPELVE